MLCTWIRIRNYDQNCIRTISYASDGTFQIGGRLTLYNEFYSLKFSNQIGWLFIALCINR